MQEPSRPFVIVAKRVLRTPVGWFLFQILEFLVLLWASREFADDVGIRWDLLLLISVVVVTVLNYRLRTRLLAEEGGTSGTERRP